MKIEPNCVHGLAKQECACCNPKPTMMKDDNPYHEIYNPSHYKGKTLESIDIIEDFNLNFRLGNVIKYVLRAGKKEDRLKDLKKAEWYLAREIEKGERNDRI